MKVSDHRLWILIGLPLYLFSCQRPPSNGTGHLTPGTDNGDSNLVSDTQSLAVCDQMPDLGLDISAAAAVPTLTEGVMAILLGQESAQTLADEMTSGETFCDVEPSAEAQAVIDSADALANAGQKQAAAALLRELLANSSAGLKAIPTENAKLDGANAVSRTVRGLLQAAAREQFYGTGDGQDYIDAAGEIFSQWAGDQLSQANAQEALSIATQAMLLLGGDSELVQDAMDRSGEVVKQELENVMEGFFPCGANETEIRNLLNAVARVQLLGVDSADGQLSASAFDAAAQAAKRMGKDAAAELLGGADVSKPECDGYRFQATVTTAGGSTVTLDMDSCYGVNWTGTLVIGGAPAGAPLDLAAPVTVELPSSVGGSVQATVTVLGTATFDGNVADVTDPLQLVWTVDLDNRTATATVASTMAGSAVFHDPPITSPFATVFPQAEITGTLGTDARCASAQ